MSRGAGGKAPWRPQLTKGEKRMGWAFFACYLFLLPMVVGGVVRVLDERLGLSFSAATSSAVYYLLVLGLLVAAFWEFLRHAGRILGENWPGNLLALGGAVAAGLILTCLVSLIPLPVENPVYVDYPEQFALSPVATALVVAVLRPAVEEILYRGLLFGSLRKVNRPVAYGVSAGLFALAAVWQFVFPGWDWRYLLLAVRYLPLGLALSWCYDVGGSVFTPVAARITLSAIFLALSLR